jgi:hypothetical protein
VVSKPPLEPNLSVGENRLILEIPNVFIRLNAFSPRFYPAGFRREILGPMEAFETTSLHYLYSDSNRCAKKNSNTPDIWIH